MRFLPSALRLHRPLRAWVSGVSLLLLAVFGALPGQACSPLLPKWPPPPQRLAGESDESFHTRRLEQANTFWAAEAANKRLELQRELWDNSGAVVLARLELSGVGEGRRLRPLVWMKGEARAIPGGAIRETFGPMILPPDECGSSMLNELSWDRTGDLFVVYFHIGLVQSGDVRAQLQISSIEEPRAKAALAKIPKALLEPSKGH